MARFLLNYSDFCCIPECGGGGEKETGYNRW